MHKNTQNHPRKDTAILIVYLRFAVEEKNRN